jgi:hypothetical protein
MKFEKKFGLSEIIATVALILSGVAIWQSILARNDARILNKLDFRPTLSLRAQLQNINDKIPAHINLKNKGPVDAIQVEVQFHYHRYFPDKKKAGASATGSDQQWTIDRLPSLKQVNIRINEPLLDSLLPAMSDIEKYYRILEIRLNYRREVDLKEYSESAFYFVSQEGKWVSERSSALNSEFYEPIKKAAISRFTVMSDMLNGSDNLHEVSK